MAPRPRCQKRSIRRERSTASDDHRELGRVRREKSIVGQLGKSTVNFESTE